MRLIDADALSQKWQNVLKEKADEKESVAYQTFELFIDRLKNEPTIEAEVVVRCEDCEAFYPKDKNFLQHCTRTGLVVHKNDFCSGGERREKNEHDIINCR